MSSPIWCKECGSDTEGVHYGSCPLHPTNQNMSKRYGQPKTSPQPAQTTNHTSSPHKSDWFSGDYTLIFSTEQMKKVVEYFLLNVLDLPGVEVVELATSKAAGTKVTFKQKPPVIDIPVEPVYNDKEMEELNAMVESGQVN